MSVWLGAPAIKMKMQFFALFALRRSLAFGIGLGHVADEIRTHYSRAHDVEEPAAREVRTVEERNVRMRIALHKFMNRSRSDMALTPLVVGSVIENEIHFVVQRPEQVSRVLAREYC